MPFSSKFPPLDLPSCNVLSYVFPPNKPLSDKPLWIEAANPSINLSQTQMLSWVKRFAVGLDKMGVAEQQTVMVFTPNHIFVPLAYLATVGSKRVFTGANPSYTVNEVAYQMKTIEAAVVLIHPSLLTTGLAAAEEAHIPKTRLFQFAETECCLSEGIQDWRKMVASNAEAGSWQWSPLDGDLAGKTIAAINFSSGTTGLPKGVCITHRNLVSNAAQSIFCNFQGTGQSDANPGDERWLAFLPLYHAYSQLWTISLAGRLQIPVYIMPKFSFNDFLSYIEQFRITTLQTVPPILLMLTKRPESTKYDLSSVRHMICGAAPLSADLQNEVCERFKVVVSYGWGMTETTCAAIITPGMTVEQTASVGYLFPNTEAMLMEDGNEITRDGEPGELYVRGPQNMLKYWANPEATQDTLSADGWLQTGDIAVTREGKFWIVDRKKELIKVNALQVAPAELEALLLGSDDIADAGVVGITVHREEAPRAYVVLQDHAKGKVTEQDVQEFAKARVSKHKRLTGGVIFVNEIPRLASGKIIRKQLKEWAKRDAKGMEGRMVSRL